MTLSYVLVTPARNEEAHIGGTIESMILQSSLPKKWVIVSDGSTDRTDAIVQSYSPRIPWIDFLRMPERRDRHFAAKVSAFNAGLERLNNLKLEYDVIGNLDADITLPNDYFDYLLDKFGQHKELGVAGTPVVENGKQLYDFRYTNIEHVSGACQLFRRKCFEDIGGYRPIRGGGIDWVAVTTARMKGWKTRTYTDRTCFHHRAMGTAEHNELTRWFRSGKKDYFLGGHPLWQLFRAIYQMSRRPYFVGGLGLLAGYSWAALTRTERPISEELIRFNRQEQLTRLCHQFRLGRK